MLDLCYIRDTFTLYTQSDIVVKRSTYVFFIRFVHEAEAQCAHCIEYNAQWMYNSKFTMRTLVIRRSGRRSLLLNPLSILSLYLSRSLRTVQNTLHSIHLSISLGLSHFHSLILPSINCSFLLLQKVAYTIVSGWIQLFSVVSYEYECKQSKEET